MDVLTLTLEPGKPRFLRSLETEYLGYLDGKYRPWKRPWERLTAPLVYWTGKEIITVPLGFVSDKSSVPRIPLAWLFFGGTANRAGVLHDYLYREGYDREWADEIFYQAILATNYSKVHAGIMWSAVRTGGYFAYSPKPGVLDPRPKDRIKPTFKI